MRFGGRNVEEIKEFEKHGGTHIVLVRIPPPTEDGRYIESYEETLRLADHVRKNTNVKVFVVLGPYPVELLRLERKLGFEKAKEAMKKGVESAAKYVEDGKVIAIGEVGRPHFPVDERIWNASNEIMQYSMSVAKDAGCPVQLHTESAGPDNFKELATMADKVGLAREKVIKHFSAPVVEEGKNMGIFPSIIASEKNIMAALSQGDRFFMESDYLDDPRRPGAVIAPSNIPRKTKKLLETGVISEETALKIHKDNPEKIYGVKIE
ncbi:MAG: TatD family hydrolase [Thermoplasmata archaeon]|nr:MAG: TatD family hydrolase [Thermoplasmata archaeon]